jgi:glutamate/aspartate transport system permease protein
MFANFDFSVLAASLPFLWKGFLFSARLTLIAMTGGIVIGTLLAMARLSAHNALAFAARSYVNLMRSIPLVLVILWFFLVIPLVTDRPVGAENSAIVTFIAFEAAFFAEIMRAGIQSVPKGQVAASYALGMNYNQTMAQVVLPQALRNMLPLLLMQTIVLFQDTSLVYAIGARDLLRTAEITGKNYNRPAEMYIFVALIYFLICFSLSVLTRQLQRRLAPAH